MKDLLAKLDETPCTMLAALAYVTLAFLTDPMRPSMEALHAYGAMRPVTVSEGEAWRLVTGAFLHGGFLHLVFNTWFLLQIGPPLERSLGSVRWAVLYVVAAIGGNLAVCLCQEPLQMVVGGSGAIFGMLGAAVALQMRAGRHAFSFLAFEGPRQLLGLIAANLVIGFLVPVISNTAHVGGLVAGFGVSLLFLLPPRGAPHGLGAWRVVGAALFATVLFHALLPVTRWDWLWNRSVEAQDEGAAARLRRAAVVASGAPSAAALRLELQQLVEDVPEFEPYLRVRR